MSPLTDDEQRRRWQLIVEQLREQGTPPPPLLPVRWRLALLALWVGVALVWWVLLVVAVRWVAER